MAGPRRNLSQMLAICAALSLGLDSCTEQEGLTESEKNRIRLEVQDMLGRYDTDIMNSGLMAEFAYLDSSDDFFWVPPGFSQPLSFDSVAAIIKHNARMFRTVENAWDTLRIIPYTNSLATFTGVISSHMVDTSGNVTNVSLIETGLAIRRHDGWKMLSGQTAVLN